MNIFRGIGVYVGVYNGDDNFITSGATLLSDLDLQKIYRAIASFATGRIPSLSCEKGVLSLPVGKLIVVNG